MSVNIETFQLNADNLIKNITDFLNDRKRLLSRIQELEQQNSSLQEELNDLGIRSEGLVNISDLLDGKFEFYKPENIVLCANDLLSQQIIEAFVELCYSRRNPYNILYLLKEDLTEFIL